MRNSMTMVWRSAGLMLAAAAMLVACDATEPNPVNEDSGIANPGTASSNSLSPHVAPPSEVDLKGNGDDNEQWTQPDDHKQSRFLGLVMDKPATWIEHPPATSMELTRYTVPGRDGNPSAEIVVFYFGAGMGGSVEDNIARWRNQFEVDEDGNPPEAEVTEHAVGEDIQFTLIEILGSWARMGAASYTPNQHFVAAIVACPRGPLFIRFVGDEVTVGPNRDAFVDILMSMRADDS